MHGTAGTRSGGTTDRAGRPADATARSRTADRGLLLRREVGRFRARESRRVFDTAVHVGVLGGERTGFVVRAGDLPVLDAGLRTEVVSRLLGDAPDGPCSVWFVRAGELDVEDADLAWQAAARAAFAEHGRELDGCYVLTRHGWRDLVTGASRSWVRLRL